MLFISIPFKLGDFKLKYWVQAFKYKIYMFGESGYPKQTPPLTLDKSVKNRRFIKYAKHDDAISSSALKSEIGNHI